MIKNFICVSVIAFAMAIDAATIPTYSVNFKGPGVTHVASSILQGEAFNFNTSNNDWTANPAPIYVDIRSDGFATKALQLSGANKCSPYKEGGKVLGEGSFSFMAVAKLAPATGSAAKVLVSGGEVSWSSGKSGLSIVYHNEKVKLLNWKKGSETVVHVETAVENCEDVFHVYMVAFDRENQTAKLFIDGKLIEQESYALTYEIGTADNGFQLGGIWGGANQISYGGASCEKAEGFQVDEAAVWRSDVSSEALEIAECYPLWPDIINKDVDESSFQLSSMKGVIENSIINLHLAAENPTIIVDVAMPDIGLIYPTFTGTLTIKKTGAISASEFGEILAKIPVNGLELTNLTSESNEIKIKANGALVIEEGKSVTCNVDYGETYKLKGVEGAGTLIKTGDGDLRLEKNGEYAINGTTVDIQAGLVTFYSEGSAVMRDPTFIFHEDTKVDNYGWPSVTGTLTLKSDADVTIFTNTGNGSTGSKNTAEFEGNPAIIKQGAGTINLMCGASNDSSHNNIITSVEVKEGILAFGGNRAKVIKAVSGEGTLEEAGVGAMTISKIASETSLKVSAGTLNNECAAGNGSITLAGLEIAGEATYTMKPAIDHLNITKSFYLEGDAHKNWYVSLAEGATVSTNPANPMELKGLEFEGKIVYLRGNLSVGNSLAKTIKPKNFPEQVKIGKAGFESIDFTLDYVADSLVIARTFTATLETIPLKNLIGAIYKINFTNLPEELRSSTLYAKLKTPSSSTSEIEVKITGDGEGYVIIEPGTKNEASGAAHSITVDLCIKDENGEYVSIDSYKDISVNVRPKAKNEEWINESAYDRWNSGSWDTEGDYITIADGFIQVEGVDKRVSFIPENPNSEAAAKLHFSVKFGKAMRLAVLNAITDSEQIAGVGLIEENGETSFAAWDPENAEYVAVKSSSQRPIDFDEEHLVEVILAKGSVSYAVDGAALMLESKIASFKQNSIAVGKVDFVGKGAVRSLTGEEYSTKLAEYKGVEYDTIEKAIIAAKADEKIVITPLWDATWQVSADEEDIRNKIIVLKGEYDVDTKITKLSNANLVLHSDVDQDGNKMYSIISKYLTISVPDPEQLDGFGAFLESITANSIQLKWIYEYPDTLAKATVEYGDDVTINFSTTIQNKGLLVDRATKNMTLESVTFKDVRAKFENNQVITNIVIDAANIPVIDTDPIPAQKTLAKFGVVKQDVAKAESVGILDFTTAANGVTFTVGLLDADGNDITKIVAEQIGDMVYFAEKLGDEWKPVGAENVEVITNDDGVKVMFAQQKDTTSGFYKVVIPAE